MTDYIKREDALKQFDWYVLEYRTTQIKGMLMDVPSADVAPVRHGRWGHERLPSTSGGSYAVVRCSACEYQYPMAETRYCPNCGAIMDGGELGETD